MPQRHIKDPDELVRYVKSHITKACLAGYEIKKAGTINSRGYTHYFQSPRDDSSRFNELCLLIPRDVAYKNLWHHEKVALCLLDYLDLVNPCSQLKQSLFVMSDVDSRATQIRLNQRHQLNRDYWNSMSENDIVSYVTDAYFFNLDIVRPYLQTRWHKNMVATERKDTRETVRITQLHNLNSRHTTSSGP